MRVVLNGLGGTARRSHCAADPIDTSAPTVLNRLRSLLLGLVLFGSVGLGAELVLTEHWESWTQRIPMLLLALIAVGAVAALVRPSDGVLRTFRGVLLLAVLSGVVGSVLHFRSNAELERELAPERPSLEVGRAALFGGVPTLAPGAMIQLGLMGLLALYRYPGPVPHERDASTSPPHAG